MSYVAVKDGERILLKTIETVKDTAGKDVQIYSESEEVTKKQLEQEVAFCQAKIVELNAQIAEIDKL